MITMAVADNDADMGGFLSWQGGCVSACRVLSTPFGPRIIVHLSLGKALSGKAGRNPDKISRGGLGAARGMEVC
jgi:hypothetical protein